MIYGEVGGVAPVDKNGDYILKDDQKVCEDCPTIMDLTDFYVCEDCEMDRYEQEQEEEK
jgi:hypothetical protein